MKEIREIIEEYDKLKATQAPMALATVYEVKGSSYRRTGARMLIKEDGNWLGGISGGCIEGNALKKARLVMADGRARLVTYDTSKDDAASIGVSLGCNGVISVIIAPITSENHYNPIMQLRKIVDSRSPVILITVLDSEYAELAAGSVLNQDDLAEFARAREELVNLKGLMQNVLDRHKSSVIAAGSLKLFVEFLSPNINLVIMGGNYDVYPLMQIASTLGWKKTIVCNPKRLYSPAKSLADAIYPSLTEVEIDKQTVGIIMSHDYQADLQNLELALATDLRYIGVLGPAVRTADMINELSQKGLKVDRSRIYGPAGLDIGALQPDEIALSITGEILSVLRQRSGESLRERQTTIHDREIDSKAEVM